MRSELNEIYLIDSYLLRQLGEEEARSFEARLLIDEALAEKVESQREIHRLIRRYGRRIELVRIESVYRQLTQETRFSHQIKTIFS